MLCGVIAQGILLHEVTDDIVNDDLFIVAVYLLDASVFRAVGEVQRLIDCGNIGVVVDIALIVHLAENGLLPFLIVLLIVERVIVGRLVRDADYRRALGQRQIPHVLAEVFLRGRLHAVAALAEVDGVEIPSDYLLLIVILLKLQRAEYLRQLALHGDFVVAGEVLDKLLGYGGAAEVILHGGEHLDKCAGGAVPVNALMLVKTLVLYCDKSVFHVLRYLVVIDPDSVLIGGKLHKLLPVAGGVFIEDRTGFGKLIVLQ